MTIIDQYFLIRVTDLNLFRNIFQGLNLDINFTRVNTDINLIYNTILIT